MEQNQQSNTDYTINDPHTTSSQNQQTTANPLDGQPYDTPGGMHGFVYHTSNTSKPRKTKGGVGRGALIAACITGGLILLMGVCLLGAGLGGQMGRNFWGASSADSGYEYEAQGTTNGLVIADVTTSLEEDNGMNELQTQSAVNQEHNQETVDDTQHLEQNGMTNELTTIPLYDDFSKDTIPNISDQATIDKKSPHSQDKNSDGKPDIAFDDNGNVITSAGSVCLNTATVAAKVAASVVEISTETLVESNRNGQYITSGAGSGVIIAKEGYIVTNHHVIDGVDNIMVRLSNGKQFAARLVGTDEATDIAVLYIDPDGYELTVAKLGSSFDLVAGEDVVAIGNPLGSLGGTVTEGIISATERRINMEGNVMTLLQVSSPINPGNSGGGLFNMAGELVGVVNAKVSSEEIEGLGFAIPVDIAYQIICELIEYRYVRGRVSTGLTLVDVTSISTAMYYFGTRATGVYVYDSLACPNLQYGDRILSVEGQTLANADALHQIVADRAVGDEITFVVNRKNQEITVILTLVEYVPDYLTETDA